MMKFPQANGLVTKLKDLWIRLKASDDIQLDFSAESTSPSDATALSQLLEAGMLSKQYQANQNNPNLAKILDSMRITPYESHLNLSLNMTDDQMQSLVEHDTFSLSM
jgi:hypothetical protein